MIEKLVKNKSTSLFIQRVKDAESFWNRISSEKKNLLLGNSSLLDGNIERANTFLENIPSTFQTKYNLMNAYKRNGNMEQYKKLKEELMTNYANQYELNNNKTLNKKVAFFLSYLGNTGAMKILLLHKRWLEELGYEVTLFVPYPDKNKVLSYSLFNQKLELITYSSDKELRKIASKYDIAYAPHWDHLFPLQQHFKKVFFFTQGDYDIFSEETNVINLLNMFYSLPVDMFTVSNFLASHVSRKQSRIIQVIPCGIDLNQFNPGDKFIEKTILVVGTAAVQQKNISNVLTHLLLLKQRLNFNIVWINPQENIKEVKDIIVVNDPDPETLAMYYRKSHLFVSGSEIESFSLPPLEAMASGTAVVSANNGGILQYGIDGHNLCLFEPKEWSKMINLVEELLTNDSKRELLSINGINTAQDYDIKKVKIKFQEYINKSTNSFVITN